MFEKIKEYIQEVQNFQSTDPAELENFRIRFNGKKGILTQLFDDFKQIPNEQKKAYGQEINALKQAFLQKFEELKSSTPTAKKSTEIDLTRPWFSFPVGYKASYQLSEK